MSILIGAIILIILTVKGRAMREIIRHSISRIINISLLRYYTIKHVEHGTNLPSLPYVFPNGQGNIEKFLRGRTNSFKWQSEYGSVYRLWSGMTGEVVLTKPAHVEAVFRDSHNHSAVRSSVEAPFLHRSIGQYAEDVQDFTASYMRRIGKGDNTLGQQGLLHPVHDLKRLPFFFVAKIIYGPLNAVLERELTDLLEPREKLFKRVIDGGITRFAFSRLLPLPAIRALISFKNRWARWNDHLYCHALEIPKANSKPPIVAMYRAVENGKITREQLLQTLYKILFANIDVTTGNLSWTLIFLAANPSTQRALRNEICEQSSNQSSRSTYLLSSWTTAPTLLGACILEASRLRPLAAFSTPQACPTARNLDGFEIPAGTNFIIDSYALNIRDPFWGADREKFHPERWLERHKSGRDLRYRYWRFGFGPRTCLGKYLTELILRSVIVEILETWYITLDDKAKGGEVESTEDDDEQSSNGEMDWPFDDELWIHSPHLRLKCQPLRRSTVVRS
ncbi:putative cytochrome P450 oxidoreductase GliC-like protein [Xylaria sp. FL0064]|nr:putative cytochrome P450 oxidoreductase GliC-like protein [Xylaria sp. FL0064]